MWLYLQVSDKWDSTVDGRSTDEVVIFDVLGVLIWQIHHQVYIFILNQSVTKQRRPWELKNFKTQSNNLEAKARNASKPAHFWLPILSFLQSQFTCKNWFAFVNNSVPWILITWSCGGDAHRSPGHPMGCLQITKTSHGECAQMKWTYHGGARADQVDTQWDMRTHQGHIPYSFFNEGTECSTFSCGLILRRFCTKGKKLSDIDFLQRKSTANAKVQIPSAAKTVTAEEVIVMKMTNREN